MKYTFRILAFAMSFSYNLLSQPVIQTNVGKVEGILSSDGEVSVFKGIPFATPPVGDLRWKAPQAVKPWDGTLKCKAFGPSPMQNKPVPFSMWSREFLIPEEPISEDCLYLNVWTTAKSPAEKLPVLVWIYGGGFVSGGSGVPIYDGESMARKGIVFVSINYRVGIFGFLAHPELSNESKYHASGNYGLMDQIAALKWVRDNIVAFGGDPGNVTISGQSAGSISVNCLVASPLARGLFHKAIAESGASFTGTSATLRVAEEAGLEISKTANAPSLAELRSKPAEELMKTQGMRGPIIDGYVLPGSILDIFSANEQNRVDLLTGWNEDEGLIFGPVRNAEEYKQHIKQQYGTMSEKYLSYYPAANDKEASESQLKASRDLIFGTQNYTWANVQAKQGDTRIFVYRFTRKVPGTGQYANYGAFHTGEVPYAYDNLEFVDRPWEKIDRKLEHDMSAYWANFIKYGDPNGKDLPHWPEYTLNEKQVMLLGTEIIAKPIPDWQTLDFMYELLTR